MNNLEEYFSEFRENIIGINQEFTSKFGAYKIIYTDWTASDVYMDYIEGDSNENDIVNTWFT